MNVMISSMNKSSASDGIAIKIQAISPWINKIKDYNREEIDRTVHTVACCKLRPLAALFNIKKKLGIFITLL